MKEAIQNYFERCTNSGFTDISQFPPKIHISRLDAKLKAHFDRGELFVEKQEIISAVSFEREFGCPMPAELYEYLNAYWQPGIFGYIEDLPECIMLFEVVKYSGETNEDILMRENGLIKEAKKWSRLYDGDLGRFLPIGTYDPYSGLKVLYEISTGRIFIEATDDEGNDDNELIEQNGSIADSLKELIQNMRIKK